MNFSPSEAPPVPPHIAAIERPVEKLMTYYVIKALMAAIAFPIVLPILYFRYTTMRYKFDAEGIHMRWGILFRHEIMLNYSRIQDIHLQSSFIERFLGLARIEIQTAAGSSNSEMTLEGLTDHEAMRDFLYSRMRGVRDGHHPPVPVAPGGPAHSLGAAADGELAGTLRDIASELRSIRTIMEEQRRRV